MHAVAISGKRGYYFEGEQVYGRFLRKEKEGRNIIIISTTKTPTKIVSFLQH